MAVTGRRSHVARSRGRFLRSVATPEKTIGGKHLGRTSPELVGGTLGTCWWDSCERWHRVLCGQRVGRARVTHVANDPDVDDRLLIGPPAAPGWPRCSGCRCLPLRPPLPRTGAWTPDALLMGEVLCRPALSATEVGGHAHSDERARPWRDEPRDENVSELGQHRAEFGAVR